MANIERKMAYIVKIDDIIPIDGADKIECARIKGWNVVVRKGEFSVGDLAVYCEIDSWIPTKLAPFISSGKSPKEFNGVVGERLKTKKLKGVISQGLLLPYGIIMSNYEGEATSTDWNLGDDVTEILGIQKWEKPIPVQLRGEIKGNFPTHLVPRTDQERIQNCAEDIFNKMLGGMRSWAVQEKLDGSSCTFLFDENGEFTVCSRNLALRRDDQNSFWRTVGVFEDVILKHKKETGKWLAFQGELIASNIQGNPYKLKVGELQFKLFDIYDINKKSYVTVDEMMTVANKLNIGTVPRLIGWDGDMFSDANVMCKELLEYADGTSCLANVDREGIVVKSLDNPNITFKVISNKWLENE